MRFLLLFLIVCFANIFPAYADVSSDFAKHLNSIETMQANFTQTIYNQKGKVVQKAQGQIALHRPGKFRWEVTKPIPQLIIANESKLWIYDPDLEQVTIRSINKISGEAPALLLSHDNMALNKIYRIKQISKDEYELIPYHQSAFSSIQMSFLKNQIDKMQLKDHLGHLTLIQFKNSQFNKPLSSAGFIFKTPAKVDVIDETKQK